VPLDFVIAPRSETLSLLLQTKIDQKTKPLGALGQLEANVVQTPHHFRIERKPNIRRVSLRRFPFKVIFRDVESIVQILAVSHKRRRPDYWLDRL